MLKKDNPDEVRKGHEPATSAAIKRGSPAVSTPSREERDPVSAGFRSGNREELEERCHDHRASAPQEEGVHIELSHDEGGLGRRAT